MFSSTAYEALFTYLGLHLHSTSIELITSQGFFLAILLLVFGFSFVLLSFKFASKYMPGGLVFKKSIPLSLFVKLIFSVFIGISLLKVGSNTGVVNYSNKSWHNNTFLMGKLPDVEDTYRVSFIFKILSKTSDEVSRFASVIVDKMFSKTNSQLDAPDFFYKAIMVSGAATIDDKALRKLIHIYTNACFQKVLPSISESSKKDIISKFFDNGSEINSELAAIPVQVGPKTFSCLQIKEDIRVGLQKLAYSKTDFIREFERNNEGVRIYMGKNTRENIWMSNALTNYYLDQTRGPLGIHKGSILPSKVATFFQGWKTTFWTKFMHVIGLKEYAGAPMAGERAIKFSEILKRAPHIKGVTKMILILIFPWLVFLVVAGKWKVLVFWFAIYTSVCLWTPIWTFFYHIMTSIALSNDVLAHFGQLSDGVSLYGSKIITSKLFTFFSVYSWIQVLSGPLPTTILGFYLSPLLKDSEQEDSQEVTSVIKTGATMATGNPGTSMSINASSKK